MLSAGRQRRDMAQAGDRLRWCAGNAETLQVGVGAEVNIAAKHAGADESNLDFLSHAAGICRS